MNQEQHNQQEKALAKLRELIEGVVERKMKTPKDFEFLSECIFDKFHERISPTTLKRIWGYLSETTTPRKSTLDILSKFVGYDNWKDFTEGTEDTEKEPEEEKATEKEEGKTQKKRFSPATLYTIIALLLIGIIAGVSYQVFNKSSDKSSAYTLKIGDTFSSPHEYLKLFGIHATEKLWGQILPRHPNISVWGPNYRHSEWHNEGDKSKMMPTITEYWKPEGVDSDQIVQRNIDHFNHNSRLNEIRITFMKNLVDTNYVYLGVYRMSMELSDSTKVVWERVAEECDLNKIDYLELLRN
ncbi:MAG: hypothetical protein VZR36_05785 [Prevotella sp.]|nr:hypothetical protein [Prevotella sp.]